MDIIAAIAEAPHSDFSVKTVQIGVPRAHEALIRIVGVGLCHTDLVARDQFIPIPLPAVLGHEGAGIVEAVGSAVTKVRPGDAVVIGFSSCGHCPRCQEHLPSYCREFPMRNYAGALGCGLQTGAGAVMRSMDCPPGASLAIFGGGPVGQAAVMAAAARACATIILVEPQAARRTMALELGATHVIDPAEGDVSAAIRAILPDGVDFALETSGQEPVVEAALASLGSHAMLGLVGVPPRPESSVAINLASLITYGHRIIGIIEGDSDLDNFIPELIAMHQAGRFPFEKLVTTYPLARINEAVEAQHRGDCIKAVLIP